MLLNAWWPYVTHPNRLSYSTFKSITLRTMTEREKREKEMEKRRPDVSHTRTHTTCRTNRALCLGSHAKSGFTQLCVPPKSSGRRQALEHSVWQLSLHLAPFTGGSKGAWTGHGTCGPCDAPISSQLLVPEMGPLTLHQSMRHQVPFPPSTNPGWRVTN